MSDIVVMDLSKLPKTHIRWVDSCASSYGWTPVDDLDEIVCVGLEIETLGFILKENDEYIAVTQNVSADNEGTPCPAQYCAVMTIPKVSILSRNDF